MDRFFYLACCKAFWVEEFPETLNSVWRVKRAEYRGWKEHSVPSEKESQLEEFSLTSFRCSSPADGVPVSLRVPGKKWMA